MSAVVSCVVSFTAAYLTLSSRRIVRRDYLRKSADDKWLARQRMMERAVPKPDWFPGEKEEADAWLARQKQSTEPPGHEMCRCVVEEPWITIPGGRSYTLAEVQAMRKHYPEPINSAAWTGRDNEARGILGV